MSEAKNEFSGKELHDLAEIAMEQAKRVSQKIPVLGPVTWLMMQQGATRHTLLSDLEWRIMPPLVLDQAKLYMREQMPLAFVTWATLSDDVVSRYRKAPHHLTASDWRSGEQVWIIDLIAPYGGVQDILTELRTTIFPGQVIHQLAPMPQGEAKVIKWEAVASPVKH
ncbi:toxin-activating lysine-acyltransferase [Herbaspirillum sp. alder98]|uniref:toxin-activating lysine-acyltransferase n=1 Tax=Herbaspirillum sp. alder98 TaxID=2913096 RepID=UPI001CD88EE4|nr:toxin-activating lysine-acyltransferase [Herbaspirillum sp. alder98]MCA1323481.1 toxin-activating lysine-acyltransferase [Herbaspirillum sp. alder98]